MVNFKILVALICYFISDFFVQHFDFWFHKFLSFWPLSVNTCHWVCVTKRCEFTWTLNFAWYDVEQMSAVSSGLFSSEKLSTTTLLSDFKLSRTFMTIEVLSKGTLKEFQAWYFLWACCSGQRVMSIQWWSLKLFSFLFWPSVLTPIIFVLAILVCPHFICKNFFEQED